MREIKAKSKYRNLVKKKLVRIVHVRAYTKRDGTRVSAHDRKIKL